MRRWVACTIALAALVACDREARRLQQPPAPLDASVPRAHGLVPGPADAPPPAAAPASAPPYDETNAYAIAQGKRLFRWFNCNGCHAYGGGGMGPPLMDAEWRYGSEPAQIAETILRGRPNGMPSFAGRIPQDQVWQLVAYVRSMSGQVRADALPGRGDTLSPGQPEVRRDPQPKRREGHH
jgi:cytochrome c oxidase cbb3-type subunit 3